MKETIKKFRYTSFVWVPILLAWILSFCPIELIGFAGGEVYGHAWGHWWHLQDIPSSLYQTDWTSHTQNFPLIDVLPTIISNLFGVFDIAFGYNCMAIFSVMLCFYGGYRLAISQEGNGVVGGLVLCASPIFWGSINSGLTEDFGLGLVALVFAHFCSPHTHTKKWWLGALLVSGMAWWGLVLGWMGAVGVATAITIHILCYSKNRLDTQTMLQNIVIETRLLFVCFVFSIPLLWLHWDRLWQRGHRFGTHNLEHNALWMLNPWKHNDIASMFYAFPQEYGNEIIRLHPSYLGGIAFGVALFSKTKQKMLWWILFAVIVLLSCGETLYFMGMNTDIPNPIAYIYSFLPGYALLNHHGRWMPIALVPFAVLISTSTWSTNKYIIGAIVLEWWTISPMGFPFMGTPPMKDSQVLQQLATHSSTIDTTDRIVRLPIVGPGVSFQQALWEQHVHQRKLWLHPNRPNLANYIPLSTRSEFLEKIAFTKTLPADFCFPTQITGLLVTRDIHMVLLPTLDKPIWEDERYAFWSTQELQPFYCVD